MSDLKPCPFCGGEAVSEPVLWNKYAVKPYQVECCMCFATGPIARTKEEAITAWNTHAEVNRLRSALERIADPKSLDCANWLTVEQIREFAAKTLKGGE